MVHLLSMDANEDIFGIKDLKLPDFIGDSVKWFDVVVSTDNEDKFYALMRKLLYDDNLNIAQFYDLIKKLAYDIYLYHLDEEIISVMKHVHNSMKYVKDYLELQEKYKSQ